MTSIGARRPDPGNWFGPNRGRRYVRVNLELVEEIQPLPQAGMGDHPPKTGNDVEGAQQETGV